MWTSSHLIELVQIEFHAAGFEGLRNLSRDGDLLCIDASDKDLQGSVSLKIPKLSDVIGAAAGIIGSEFVLSGSIFVEVIDGDVLEREFLLCGFELPTGRRGAGEGALQLRGTTKGCARRRLTVKRAGREADDEKNPWGE